MLRSTDGTDPFVYLQNSWGLQKAQTHRFPRRIHRVSKRHRSTNSLADFIGSPKGTDPPVSRRIHRVCKSTMIETNPADINGDEVLDDTRYWCLYIYIYIYMYIGVHTCIYVGMYAYMRAYMRIYIYIYIYICVHICIYAWIYAYMHAYKHICAHRAIYASIYAYMHAHMSKHTQMCIYAVGRGAVAHTLLHPMKLNLIMFHKLLKTLISFNFLRRVTWNPREWTQALRPSTCPLLDPAVNSFRINPKDPLTHTPK